MKITRIDENTFYPCVFYFIISIFQLNHLRECYLSGPYLFFLVAQIVFMALKKEKASLIVEGLRIIVIWLKFLRLREYKGLFRSQAEKEAEATRLTSELSSGLLVYQFIKFASYLIICIIPYSIIFKAVINALIISDSLLFIIIPPISYHTSLRRLLLLEELTKISIKAIKLLKYGMLTLAISSFFHILNIKPLTTLFRIISVYLFFLSEKIVAKDKCLEIVEILVGKKSHVIKDKEQDI